MCDVNDGNEEEVMTSSMMRVMMMKKKRMRMRERGGDLKGRGGKEEMVMRGW